MDSICPECSNVRITRNTRGSQFYLCGLSGPDSLYLRYPPQPVLSCPGFDSVTTHMHSKHTTIKNLIIDLGGVLYAIDYAKIETGMAALQENPEAENIRYSRSYQDELFTLIETGKITPEAFFQGMKTRFGLKDDPEAFYTVWNSMLMGLIPGRAELIKQLKEKYRIFLLSNTNEIHHRFLLPECESMFQDFEKCYFSQNLGMRKPEPEIFQYVLKEQNLLPEETLFIEDSEQHILSAQALGIHTLFVKNDSWPSELSRYLN